MKCKICNNLASQIYNGPLRRYFDEEMNKPDVAVFNCDFCNISFLSKNLIDNNYYDEDYYKNSKKMPDKIKRLNEARLWHDKLNSLGIKVNEGSKILGFGAGTGDFESQFEDEVIIDTVEPDKNIREKFLQFCNQNYSSILECPNSNYDYIFSFDTLEHIENLEQIVTQLYQKLDKDGIIVIGVPNLKDLYLEIFPKYKNRFYHHEHIWYLSIEFLDNLLVKNQFKVLASAGLHKYDFNNFLKWSKVTNSESFIEEVVDGQLEYNWKEYLEKHIISSHILIVGRK